MSSDQRPTNNDQRPFDHRSSFIEKVHFLTIDDQRTTINDFAQQLLYTRDIEESEMGQHLLPKYPVSRENIRAHFQAEIKKYYEKLQQGK